MIHIGMQSLCVCVLSYQQVYYTPTKHYQVTDPSYNISQQIVQTNNTRVTLTGLYGGSVYTIRVSAVNEIGIGDNSSPVTAVIKATGEGERERERERETKWGVLKGLIIQSQRVYLTYQLMLAKVLCWISEDHPTSMGRSGYSTYNAK